MQDEVCGRHLSLGSFSEAQGVFGSGRLEGFFAELLRTSPDAIAAPPGTARSCCMKLIDSTVISALSRMGWAEWRHRRGGDERAVRLHLMFNVLRGEPGEVSIAPARTCERAAIKKMVQPGEFYVGDRNYSRDYGLLEHIENGGGGYLVEALQERHPDRD